MIASLTVSIIPTVAAPWERCREGSGMVDRIFGRSGTQHADISELLLSRPFLSPRDGVTAEKRRKIDELDLDGVRF